MNKIEISDWNYRCGDGCCTDWGTDLIVNGERITDQFNMGIEELRKLLDVLNVQYEIEIEEEE